MSRKDNLLDNPNTDESRKKRANKKQKSRAGKVFLTALAIVVVALGAFVATIKIAAPDFDFTTLLPDNAAVFVNENILGKITTEPPTTTTTTTTTTTVSYASYLPIEDFEINTAKTGNQIGNLLNGGKAATDYSYIYHIVDGEGIYRIVPSNEGFARIYKTADRLSCLNLRGDYIYFINDENGKLLRLKKGSSKAEEIAQNARFVYVYDKKIYYVTRDNSLCIMDSGKLESKTLYNSADDELTFMGISKNGVYFTVKDYLGNYSFMTVDNKAERRVQQFREPCSLAEYDKFVMESGFMYFIKNGETPELYRKKFGSDREYMLADKVDVSCYPVVENNRAFYAENDDSKFSVREVNMNSNAKKTMLSVKGAESGHTLKYYHGGEYDFIIGKKADGTSVYNASSQYTGSSNVMKFKNSAWKY